MNDLKKKLSNLPMCPGVYIMKDAGGNVIYVGKSKVLKNRVNQYFQKSVNHSPKTLAMVKCINDFEYILTDTESEALALECNLIKKHRPKYNILLKDDKQYPYIKITAKDDFPRVFVTRNLKKDGSLYFGPYMNTISIREALDEIRKTFKIRSCNKKITADGIKSKPCLYYHIGQCSAPCNKMIDKEEYDNSIKQITDVLNGNVKKQIKDLTEKMFEASQNMEYEKAALLRDRINGIKILGEKQRISSAKSANRDVIGICEENETYCIQIFYYRDGKTEGSEYFVIEEKDSSKGEILESFIKQFYFTNTHIPSEIILSEEIEDTEAISEWLTETAAHKVLITVPKKGEKLKVADMVVKNAEESLYKYKLSESRGDKRQNEILKKLTKLFNLSNIPYRIECYDISNISGKTSVGAQIVYVDAAPKKSLYRKYNIKDVVGANDYESMREVLFRRFSEGYKEEDAIKNGNLDKNSAKFLPFPDLIFLDGGKGHVSSVKELFETLGEEIPVFGLVKDDFHKTRGITDEENEFPLGSKDDLFKFLSCMQDEVHRFAITAHRKKREKDSVRSGLENIQGVGPATRKKLLKHFSGISKIKDASIKELEAVTNRKVAQSIYDFYNKEKM